jgi:hypothetical protein
MNIGDKVWVIQSNCDDDNMLALPQHPHVGKIVEKWKGKVENYKYTAYNIKVDNDLIYAYQEDIFISESGAWEAWKEKMIGIIYDIKDRIAEGETIRYENTGDYSLENID